MFADLWSGPPAGVLLQLNPPASYGRWIWVLTGLAVVLGLAGPGALWLVTWLRERRAEAYDLESVRRQTLAALDTIRADHTGGELDDTRACQRIAELVKEFAGTVTDTEVEAMTLDELQEQATIDPQLAPVGALVADLYPVVYAGHPAPSVSDLVERAQKVVRQWT